MSNLIPDKAWTHILADFITKLPIAQGYDSILVVVDWFTKMAHFVPTTEKTTAEGLVSYQLIPVTGIKPTVSVVSD